MTTLNFESWYMAITYPIPPTKNVTKVYIILCQRVTCSSGHIALQHVQGSSKKYIKIFKQLKNIYIYILQEFEENP